MFLNDLWFSCNSLGLLLDKCLKHFIGLIKNIYNHIPGSIALFIPLHKTSLTEKNRIMVTWWFCSSCWQIPTGLPRNLESALQRYGSSSYKANAVTVLDQNGKPSLTLTYGTYQIEIQSLFVMNAIKNLYRWKLSKYLEQW